MEIINADGLVVKLQDGSMRKIFLASVRFPRSVLVIASVIWILFEKEY